MLPALKVNETEKKFCFNVSGKVEKDFLVFHIDLETWAIEKNELGMTLIEPSNLSISGIKFIEKKVLQPCFFLFFFEIDNL